MDDVLWRSNSILRFQIRVLGTPHVQVGHLFQVAVLVLLVVVFIYLLVGRWSRWVASWRGWCNVWGRLFVWYLQMTGLWIVIDHRVSIPWIKNRRGNLYWIIKRDWMENWTLVKTSFECVFCSFHVIIYLRCIRVVHGSDGPAGWVRSRFCRNLAGRVESALRIFPFFTDYFCLNRYGSSNITFGLIDLLWHLIYNN